MSYQRLSHVGEAHGREAQWHYHTRANPSAWEGHPVLFIGKAARLVGTEWLFGKRIARHRISPGARTAADSFIFACPAFPLQILVVTQLAEQGTVTVERAEWRISDVPRADRHKAAREDFPTV